MMKTLSLFQKLLLILIVSVSVPVSLLGYVSYERSKDQIEEVASVLLADNVNQNAQRVARFIGDAERRSESVLGSAELQTLLRSPPPENVSEELEFIRGMNQLISTLKGPYELYIFPNELDRYPNYGTLLQYNQVTPTSEMFARAEELKGRGYWTHGWNERWKAPDFIFTRQIRSLDSFEPIGVMAIRIPHFMIREELVRPSLYPRAELIVTDREGTVLLHPDVAEYGEPSLLVSGAKRYMHASLPVTADDWVLTILLPREDIVASLNEVRRFTFWMVLVSLSLIGTLLLLIARSFTNPIKKIIRSMKKVQLGQLETLPTENRHDEIGLWMTGYNRMIESLLEQMDATRLMEREKNELERQMLILQINPHFLYNTLDSIKWKAEALNDPVIGEMVTRLANMFRFSLSGGEGWTSVERELEHVKNYVDIEMLRNPGQFRIIYSVEPALMGEPMLKLLLQPLVENAVRHGMNRRKDKNGKMMLSAYRDGEDMVFAIADNGPGPTDAKPSGGIGMSNVERRLILHFGEKYKLRAFADEGFKVVLRHPIIPRDNAINIQP